jgi:hypothetical protein
MKQRNLFFLVSILLIGCGVMSCSKDVNNEEPHVIDYGHVPAGVEAVDLGLPSGTILPAAGIQWAQGLSHGGENGCYWSGQMYENGKADAIYLSIYKESLVDVRSRIDSCSVRPVIKD